MDLAEIDVAVVVPAHNAADTLGACLDAILLAGAGPEQVLVVDDGSRDQTADIATMRGIRVIRNETALRPARARNRGVDHVSADVVLFVDADVVLAPDALQRIARHFQDPAVTAVIGSYDDDQRTGPLVSRYRNLLHHFTHQTAPAEADTFWTGIGAVRRAAFLEAGGLDSAWENIEDVEFGLRLKEAGGHILLDREAQGRHLKIWTLRSMLRTDYRGRAVPWAQLIRSGRIRSGVLNTGLGHQISALCVIAMVLGVVCWPVWHPAVWVAVVGLVAFLAVNARFLILLWRVGGVPLTLAAIPAHAAHYIAALAGYVAGRFGPPGKSA